MRLLSFAALCAAAAGCANIRFEKSPYAPRGVDIVYSAQEDLTFIAWRLRDGADPRRVEFELYQDGNWRPIDLDAAPFPAEPYACERRYLCFQYQVEGRYTWPEDVRPLRSRHEDEGLYAGGIPREQVVDVTFDIDPIALGKNDTIDLRRFDWFADNDVPLERDYQWQLVDSSRGGYLGGTVEECEAPQPEGWARLGDELAPPTGWTDAPRCMAARPARRDADGVLRVIPFPPSAELVGERQDYIPPEDRPPAIYAYMVDLLIKSDSRCERARETIVGRIDRSFGQRLPTSIRLGSFVPLDPQTGQPLSGCDQRADQDYPVRQLLESLKEAAAQVAPERVRFVLIYLNNVELPPSERVIRQLSEIFLEVSALENVTPYSWAIGSNLVMELFSWDYTTGWRPIDDRSLVGDLKSWGEYTLPFRTMRHRVDTEVRITPPVGATAPRYFKICAATPNQLTSVGLEPGGATFSPFDDYYVWPEAGVPHYTVGLEPQILIPRQEYTRQQVSVDVEVCERFCEMPFRKISPTTGISQDYDSWLEVSACQWGG